MDFTFTAEQLEFRDTVAGLLKTEVTSDSIRERWSSDSGKDLTLQEQLLAMDVCG